MTEDVRRLLGGYATGTLTSEERELLYSVALEDPALFEALADEQALRDILDDSSARAQILEALEYRRFTILGALRDWLDRPKAKVLAGIGAVLLIAITVSQVRERPVEIARNIASNSEAPALLATPDPHPAQAPKAKEQRPASTTARRTSAAVEPTPPVQLEAAKPAAPAAVADSVTQPAAVEEPPIRYTILRRDPTGVYIPVPTDFAFAPEDHAHLRVEANARGMLLVTNAGNTLYAGTVSPEVPVLVPTDFTFEGSGPGEVDVAFTSLSAAPVSMRNAFTAAEESAGGVVGGIVGGVPQSLRSKTAPAPANTVAPQVKIKINLRKR